MFSQSVANAAQNLWPIDAWLVDGYTLIAMLAQSWFHVLWLPDFDQGRQEVLSSNWKWESRSHAKTSPTSSTWRLIASTPRTLALGARPLRAQTPSEVPETVGPAPVDVSCHSSDSFMLKRSLRVPPTSRSTGSNHDLAGVKPCMPITLMPTN